MLTVLTELCKKDSGLRMPIMLCCPFSGLCRCQHFCHLQCTLVMWIRLLQLRVLASRDVSIPNPCWSHDVIRRHHAQEFRNLWLPP